MFTFEEVSMSSLILHKVGNKQLGDGYQASKDLIELDDELHTLLCDYFLNHFKSEDIFHFIHHAGVTMNDVFQYCKSIFDNPDSFQEVSVHLLKHLYEKSDHPKIKSGELYIAHLENVLVEDELVNAIGIFKSETRETYLTFPFADEKVGIASNEGVPTRKLDKGAVIFNAYEEDGYRVIATDMNGTDARFWKEAFLGIDNVPDNTFHTKTYLNICKDFVKKVYSKEEDKKEQVDFLNKSIEYFENNDSFDLKDFSEQVIEKEEYTEQFNTFKEKYEEQKGIETQEDFVISKSTLEKMRKKFKNLIKLDTKVEIKVHPNPEDPEANQKHMERGYDEQKGMYFYKIYFNREE